MKTTLRVSIFVLLAAGGMALLVGKAQGADKTLPPEVNALIRMHIPAIAPGRGGRIPGWEGGNAYRLRNTDGNLKILSAAMLYRGDVIIFATILRDEKNDNQTILDAQVLPQDLLWYYVKNSKIIYKKNSRLYEFTAMCERDASEIIVGLMRPEAGKEDCQHKTTQISRAWKIDSGTGHITTIPPDGVTCLVPAGDWCY